MVHVRRLGLLLVVASSAYVLSCGGHPGARSATAPGRPQPAPVAVPAAPVPDDAAAKAKTDTNATTLTSFASQDELVQYLRDTGNVRSAPSGDDPLAASGNMWGDAIGDAFGAGGLGLSGVGEGGGGQAAGGIGLGSVGTLGHGSGTGSGGTSVTNTQHVGVDEGGIVKVRGDHLVVLRRGRLFTVRLGDLTPISTVDAFGAGIDPAGAWYDELLVTNDTVVVIGFSYARGGTEIGLFDLDPAGHITSRATYHMRANDYYSSRNYASRLIGNKLVFYSPLYVSADERAPLSWLPAVRRWKKGATASDFATIIEPTRISRPLEKTNGALALHTVTTCDLGRGGGGGMTCTARAVMAPQGRVFYVSPGAVYVWTTPLAKRADSEHAAPSLLYRLPLDAKEDPRVLRTRGAPIDQFSFLERDGHLNVLVQADGRGDSMWAAEGARAGAMAMLRVPISTFTANVEAAPSSAYVPLPEASGSVLHNRFVGDHVLYGVGSGWGRPHTPADTRVFIHRYAGSTPPVALALAHGIDRIEPMGDDAIVVGTDGADLSFTPISLDARGAPAAAPRYTRRNASQGELRSHGFFYRDDGERSGIVGLPIRSAGAPGHRHLVEGSASVLYLDHRGLRLRELGTLAAKVGPQSDDRCRTSCVDWYGNARPLFIGERVIALMGYELVEGKLDAGRIEAVRRATFAPGAR